MLHGITVKLYTQTANGRDNFNQPIVTETAVDVANVLVGNPTSEEVADTLNLYGKKAIYNLGIPKGDTHNWENVTVEFFGKKWRTIGMPIEGIEDLIPLAWNKKVKVERYE